MSRLIDDADEKRRKAITDWWERESIRTIIARLRTLSQGGKK